MRVGLVYLRPRQVGFVRAYGAYKTSSVEAWRVMTDWLERHKLTSQVACGFGVAHDHPDSVGAELCRYDACVQLPDGYENLKADGLSFQTLPGGAFARIRHVGPYHKARNSIGKVRDVWLPGQPTLLADRRRPLLVIYIDDPKICASNKLRCDVCVPVRTHYDDIATRIKLSPEIAPAEAARHAYSAGLGHPGRAP